MDKIEPQRAAPQPVRTEIAADTLVVGMRARFTTATAHEIATLWRTFMARADTISNKAQAIPVGLSLPCGADGAFDYLCGYEVSALSDIPDGMVTLQLPARRYAVFAHNDNITGLGATYAAIWYGWLPRQADADRASPMLERYLPTFNPYTGFGGLEIWAPLTGQDQAT